MKLIRSGKVWRWCSSCGVALCLLSWAPGRGTAGELEDLRAEEEYVSQGQEPTCRGPHSCSEAEERVPEIRVGSSFALLGSVVAGGGGRSEGGGFALIGTIARPVVGPASEGDAYRIDPGFWTLTGAFDGLIFRDGFERGDFGNWDTQSP